MHSPSFPLNSPDPSASAIVPPRASSTSLATSSVPSEKIGRTSAPVRTPSGASLVRRTCMVSLSRGEVLSGDLSSSEAPKPPCGTSFMSGDQSRSRDAYAAAGVDIAAGNEAEARYKRVLAQWRHPDQLDAIGGFGGLFRMPGDDRRALVASTDGVGTKILIAATLKRYGSVGADLVNHCVNDILVVNATPLFFLDYFATGRLEPVVAAEIVAGCADACRAHGCALLGGETAEMPGLY